ncbi:MAG: CPBP family intramembrane metalloprotease [Prosthecobacter sp.]|nr:CPBP family intramembrane metalloprotease [Prosthecobacter sp.]
MDAPTLGVLRDAALLAWLAILLGVIVYPVLRQLSPGGWGSRGRVQAGWATTADSLVVAAILVVMLGGLQGASVEGADVENKATTLSMSGALVGIVVQLGICTALLAYLRLMRGLQPAQLFGLREMGFLRALFMGLLLLLPMLIMVNGTAAGLHEWMKGFWPDLDGQDVAEAFRTSQDPAAKALLAVSAVLIAPLVEEIVFRGFIYAVIKRHTDGIYAAFCSSLLFAIVHLHVGTLIPLALLALFFCRVYERTGSLLLPMVLHGLFNGTSLAVMLFFPDLQP